jgi:hypothetical protein
MDYLIKMDKVGMQLGCLMGGLIIKRRKNQPCGYISA